MGGNLLIGNERVRDPEDREIRRQFSGPFRFHDRAGGAALHRLGDKFVTVEIIAAQGHEEIARLDRSRVGTQVGDEAIAVALLESGSGELRHLVN